VAANRDAKRGRPQTVVAMTTTGRRRFQQYLAVLEQVLTDAATSQQQVVDKKNEAGARLVARLGILFC
jgi:predicted MarR family transcription regulator